MGHLLDLVRYRLLGGVGVLRPGVDAQLALDLTAELVLRQHADDRLFDDTVGVLFHQLADRACPQPAGITRVAVSQLLVRFVAAHGDLVSVDDDDEVATVDIGGECRLVLAAQQVGCRDGKAAEHHVRGVDDIPRPRGVTRLRRVGRHSAYLLFSEPVLGLSDPGVTRVPVRRRRLGMISATDIDPSPGVPHANGAAYRGSSTQVKTPQRPTSMPVTPHENRRSPALGALAARTARGAERSKPATGSKPSSHRHSSTVRTPPPMRNYPKPRGVWWPGRHYHG